MCGIKSIEFKNNLVIKYYKNYIIFNFIYNVSINKLKFIIIKNYIDRFKLENDYQWFDFEPLIQL